MKRETCSMPDCNEPPRLGQRYCQKCHCKYMKAWRARRKRQENELRATLVRLRQKVLKLEQQKREQEA